MHVSIWHAFLLIIIVRYNKQPFKKYTKCIYSLHNQLMQGKIYMALWACYERSLSYYMTNMAMPKNPCPGVVYDIYIFRWRLYQQHIAIGYSTRVSDLGDLNKTPRSFFKHRFIVEELIFRLSLVWYGLRNLCPLAHWVRPLSWSRLHPRMVSASAPFQMVLGPPLSWQSYSHWIEMPALQTWPAHWQFDPGNLPEKKKIPIK